VPINVRDQRLRKNRIISPLTPGPCHIRLSFFKGLCWQALLPYADHRFKAARLSPREIPKILAGIA
jgi:hypothetical protein